MKAPFIVGQRTLSENFGKVVLARDFRYPSGKTYNFVVWGGKTMPCIILPITPEGKVVYVNQFRHGANTFVLEIPGGNPKGKEPNDEVVRAELREEIGYEPERVQDLGPPVWFEPAASITPYLPMLATGCRKVGDPRLDETEVMEAREVSLGGWVEMIRSGAVRDSKSIAVTFLALPFLGVELEFG